MSILMSNYLFHIYPYKYNYIYSISKKKKKTLQSEYLKLNCNQLTTINNNFLFNL